MAGLSFSVPDGTKVTDQRYFDRESDTTVRLPPRRAALAQSSAKAVRRNRRSLVEANKNIASQKDANTFRIASSFGDVDSFCSSKFGTHLQS